MYHQMVNTSPAPNAAEPPSCDDSQSEPSATIIDFAEQPATTMRELAIRLEQQELVAAFGLFALRIPNIDQALDQACEVAARGLGTRFAKVLEFRPSTQDFLLCNGVGWNPGVVGNATVGADLASPAGFALRTKMPVVSNHLAIESRFRTPAVLAEHGIHRAINVIIAEPAGLPFGVLEADSSDRQQFTTHDIAFMQSLANILAASLERQRWSRAQERLVREKNMLMQEAHHRIKNSLQLVQTLLHLQARAATDAGERARLNDAASRILSIAAVHERLHEEGAVERVELGPYLQGLLRSICTSAGRATVPELDVEPMELPAEHATPIGMIGVELVMNALKYGGEPIRVTVRKTDAGVELVVCDSGPGFPGHFDPKSASGLGMRLISAMARAPGAISVDRSGPQACIRVQITFPQLNHRTQA